MGDLVLKGATSGQITLTPTAIAGTNTLTVPAKTGNLITSADTGTVSQTMLAAGISGNGPAFSAYVSSTQTLTASTWTKITFQTKEFDTGTCYNNTSGTVTLNGLSVPAYAFCPNIAGYYMVTGFVTANTTPAMTGEPIVSIYKNGAEFRRLMDANASMWGGGGSSLMFLNGSTDYVNIYAINGSATPIGGASSLAYFQAFMARSA